MGRNVVASRAAFEIEVWLRRESEVAGIVVCSRMGLEEELHDMIVAAEEEEGCSIAAAVVEEDSRAVEHLGTAAAAGVDCCNTAGSVVVAAVVGQYGHL